MLIFGLCFVLLFKKSSHGSSSKASTGVNELIDVISLKVLQDHVHLTIVIVNIQNIYYDC